MQTKTAEQLVAKKCLPCEGGVEPCGLDFTKAQLRSISDWKLSENEKWIRRSIRFKNFIRTVECLHRIADLAESEAHHPDLHITGYRNLTIELSTHAIGGLSENDFILAAKIDRLLQSEFAESKCNP
jgi:4a-hydroxytetrahydrobiopterin dehydratase